MEPSSSVDISSRGGSSKTKILEREGRQWEFDEMLRISVPSNPLWFVEFYKSIPPTPPNLYTLGPTIKLFADDSGGLYSVWAEMKATQRAACKVMAGFHASFFDAAGTLLLTAVKSFDSHSCENFYQTGVLALVDGVDPANDPPLLLLPRIAQCSWGFDAGEAFDCNG